MADRAVRLAPLVLAAALAGCHPGKAAPPPPPTIALVTAAGATGEAYNGGAVAGLRACARSMDATIDVSPPHDAAGVFPQLVLAATQNRDTIVALGGAAANDLQRVARRFPAAHFALVDAAVGEPNVTSIVFKTEEGAFLAGALAALVSRSHRVGVLGGTADASIERYAAGFVAGVRAIGGRTSVATRSTGSFTDATAARRAAEALYDQGADVVLVAAGPAGRAAIDAAAARPGRFAIGVDSDQDALAPGHVLTSVVKRVDRMTERVCAETVARKPASGRVDVGLADGAVDLTDFAHARAIVTPAYRQRLAYLRAEIERGAIVPPASLAALVRFRTVALR